jgi:2-amino-4-hydroxy-6-hydroxymethyldihydropteridine diphosphokinase
MVRAYLSLGSNLGDRRQYLDAALAALGGHAEVRVVACSPLYETEPWPEGETPRAQWYLNCAVALETSLPPRRLLHLVQVIEAQAGRVRRPGLEGAYAPRTLDIDILLYGDRVVTGPTLQIPHPLLHERRFVLVPLADIAPDVEHPTLYQRVGDLLATLLDRRAIEPYPG